MSITVTLIRSLVAAAGALPALVLAAPPDPADPGAAVPALNFTSTLDKYRAAPGTDDTPDAGWIGANDTVKASGGPMGHMGHMGHGAPAADPHAGHDMGKPAPAADPHAGHDMGKPAATPDKKEP